MNVFIVFLTPGKGTRPRILPMTITNAECIPMFSIPRTRPPPVSSCTFFIFPHHWLTTAQCTLHSVVHTRRLHYGENLKSSVIENPYQNEHDNISYAIVSCPHAEKKTPPPLLSLQKSLCSSVFHLRSREATKSYGQCFSTFLRRASCAVAPDMECRLPPTLHHLFTNNSLELCLPLFWEVRSASIVSCGGPPLFHKKQSPHCSHLQRFEEVVWSGKTVHSRRFPPSHNTNQAKKS